MMTEIHVGSCGVLHFVRVLLPLSSPPHRRPPPPTLLSLA
eukprot:COSAG05_NODE_28672_length_119_cov_62.000000_1_plen_39_part_11